MVYRYRLQTGQQEFLDITPQVRKAVLQSGVQDGICVVFCPHTTAAITINENADPDVLRDLELGFQRAFPEQTEFRHFEGNSTAHLKSSTIGCSETLLVEEGTLLLGRWQSVYFCEFDGPRSREFYVKVLAAAGA